VKNYNLKYAFQLVIGRKLKESVLDPNFKKAIKLLEIYKLQKLK
jgi:hypothetical protein